MGSDSIVALTRMGSIVAYTYVRGCKVQKIMEEGGRGSDKQVDEDKITIIGK